MGIGMAARRGAPKRAEFDYKLSEGCGDHLCPRPRLYYDDDDDDLRAVR